MADHSPGNLRPVGAAQDANNPGSDTKILLAGLDAVHYGFDDAGRIETVGLSHEPGAEAQLDIVDPLPLRVLDIFVGDTAASIIIHQDADHPLEFGDKGHDAGHGRIPGRIGHYLDVGTQSGQILGRQRQIVLATQLEDGF